MFGWIDVFFLILLVLLNGAFALSEIALITSRRARLQQLKENQTPGAQKAIELNADPNKALSTIQVGITTIGILLGIVGESALAEPVSRLFLALGLSAETANAVSLVLVVVLVTYFSIVVGELVPKRLGQLAPEKLACRVAAPISFLSTLAAPFVRLLSTSTKLLLHLFGLRGDEREQVTEEEIHALIDEGEESGVIERVERDMVRNIFRLDDRPIASLMIPRADIEWIDLDDPLEMNIEKIKRSHRSRLPVCQGGLDDVKGICTTRTLLQQILEKGKPNFHENLSKPVYVPESLSGMELLENFRMTDTPLALVVDEYGEVQGIVSPRDVLEAIAGEFKPESPADAWVTVRNDGSYLLDGLIPIPEMKDVLGIKTVPEDIPGRYATLAGMMMFLIGRLPQEGDVTVWEGWQFEVIDMDGRRIDKILVTRDPSAPTEPPSTMLEA